MKTEKNLAKVFVMALRGATQDLRGSIGGETSDDRMMQKNALESIESVAEELEKYSAAPDPAGGAR